MRVVNVSSAVVSLCVLLGTGTMHALADDPCAGFKWDVSKERALFKSSAATEAAGKDGASAPVVVPDRLYQLQLAPRGSTRATVRLTVTSVGS